MAIDYKGWARFGDLRNKHRFMAFGSGFLNARRRDLTQQRSELLELQKHNRAVLLKRWELAEKERVKYESAYSWAKKLKDADPVSAQNEMYNIASILRPNASEEDKARMAKGFASQWNRGELVSSLKSLSERTIDPEIIKEVGRPIRDTDLERPIIDLFKGSGKKPRSYGSINVYGKIFKSPEVMKGTPRKEQIDLSVFDETKEKDTTVTKQEGAIILKARNQGLDSLTPSERMIYDKKYGAGTEGTQTVSNQEAAIIQKAREQGYESLTPFEQRVVDKKYSLTQQETAAKRIIGIKRKVANNSGRPLNEFLSPLEREELWNDLRGKINPQRIATDMINNDLTYTKKLMDCKRKGTSEGQCEAQLYNEYIAIARDARNALFEEFGAEVLGPSADVPSPTGTIKVRDALGNEGIYPDTPENRKIIQADPELEIIQ